jgi:hypothetical protein
LKRIGYGSGPDDEPPPVAAALKIGEEAVDDVGLWREDVDCVHVRVQLPALLDALDIWALLASTGYPGLGRVRILAILWLRMSSSLRELSMICLVASSTTRTFH